MFQSCCTFLLLKRWDYPAGRSARAPGLFSALVLITAELTSPGLGERDGLAPAGVF